jgi:hypothetical protein
VRGLSDLLHSGSLRLPPALVRSRASANSLILPLLPRLRDGRGFLSFSHAPIVAASLTESHIHAAHCTPSPGPARGSPRVAVSAPFVATNLCHSSTYRVLHSCPFTPDARCSHSLSFELTNATVRETRRAATQLRFFETRRLRHDISPRTLVDCTLSPTGAGNLGYTTFIYTTPGQHSWRPLTS